MNKVEEEPYKKMVLQRMVAQKKNVQQYEVKISNWTEDKEGVNVKFKINDSPFEDEILITWWSIAFTA